MKKLLLGSAVLLFFAFAIFVFDVSCKKDAAAQTGSGLAQLNKIVYLSKHGTGTEIWIANYDGTSKTKVNYILPTGLIIDFVYGARLSPDGKKIFFAASDTGYGETADGIYSCNADGSNMTKIINHTNSIDSMYVGGAY